MKVIQPNQDFVRTLKVLPLFESLSEQQCAALLQCATVVSCEAGEMLFREGDPAEGFYILKTGRVKMRRISSSGKEIVLHLSGPPHMIGCKGLTLPGSRYPADAVAVDAVIALGFKRDRFLSQVSDVAEVFFSLLVNLNRRLSEIYTLQAAISEPVEQRIATLLINQATTDGSGAVLAKPKAVHLTKSLIASIVGTTTETAIRIISKWRKSGLVDTERGLIRIVDLSAMEALAQLHVSGGAGLECHSELDGHNNGASRKENDTTVGGQLPFSV